MMKIILVVHGESVREETVLLTNSMKTGLLLKKSEKRITHESISYNELF